MLLILAAFALVPLLLPLLARLMGARVFYLAAALSTAAFVQALLQTTPVMNGHIPFEEYVWLPSFDVSLSMRMDTLSWLMALIVTGVGALVMLYCRWYFGGKKEGVGLFAAVLLAFAGAMYGLVLTDDLIVLVMLWEITSILSYLLIGYYHSRALSRRAALQSLLVTTLGGLVMFVGVVLLVVHTGTTSLSEVVAMRPDGPFVSACLVLILVGALSKSAIFPFQFWLPGAMAAPTPVSAYLHAAAMVKAGIYLIARMAPGFADVDPWRPLLVSLGVFTMLLGGFQALRERDLKRILAYGTVSQLGLLTVVLGFGTRDAALAGIALLLGHALFKSSLFLVVGIIDRQLGTRDIGELSGLGRRSPVLATFSIIAVASMVGLPPTLGFVAKEAALTALLHEATGGSPWGIVALVGVVVGSVLTAAYGMRFVWGAFWRKRNVEDVSWPKPPPGFLASPVVLAALVLAGGIASPLLDPLFARYADTLPAATPGVGIPESAYHLALWHGLEPALYISLLSIALGVLVFFGARATRFYTWRRLLPFTAVDAYNASLRVVDRSSVIVTTFTQRGSLPIYVGTIFVVFVGAEATVLLSSDEWRVELVAWQSPLQVMAAPLMIAAGILATGVRKRYTAVALVAVTGLGMVLLFATSGAPDLALTQVLVETMMLVAFALVLRRLPARMGDNRGGFAPWGRAFLGLTVGATMAFVTVIAAAARNAVPISLDWAELAYREAHGRNVVNVALVDIRGWDTMGELSVLVLAATGVASLVFVTHRADNLQRFSVSMPSRMSSRASSRRPLVETSEGPRAQTAANVGSPRTWLVGGQQMRPENRSLILEVVVRILFHTIIIISLFLLFAGHNYPGGGFAGGLVAGMALVMRYVAGGRWELGAAAPTDAGLILGAGMTLAVGSAVVPIFFGLEPLQSMFWEWEWPVLGHMEFVTSTIFDVGVYLVVIGLVLDVLRSLGAEVDRQTVAARREREGVGA